MTKSSRIIVSGLIAQYPLGGMTWHYLQYLVGLKLLGHDVYYLEDTGQYPYNPHKGGVAKDCTFNVDYLHSVLSRFGLGDKWAYRFPWQSQWFGLRDEERLALVNSADLLLNVSGTLGSPRDYRTSQRLAYIDTDPVFTQVKLARGQRDFRSLIDLHDVHFSFGESLTALALPTGHQWRPTRQPILISEWATSVPHGDCITTIMNWTSHNDVTHDGKTYGQKDVEFKRFIELPHTVAPTCLEIAVNAGKTRRTPRDLLAHKGWRVVDPNQVCPDLDSYRRYIQSSKAEWSVAKNGYVTGQAGWFSERSACYLAAGRPVITQETGFSRVLPTGDGLIPFKTFEEAVDAIRRVESDYAHHSQSARAIAEDFFDSDKVLSRLIEEALA